MVELIFFYKIINKNFIEKIKKYLNIILKSFLKKEQTLKDVTTEVEEK